MNSIIQEEFDHRQDDIELIIELVKKLSKGSTLDILNEENEDIETFDYQERLIDTLSSVICLMTYNQIESTMRGCLEALYDDISDNNISYDALKEDIQKEVLNGILKKYDTGKSLHNSVGSALHLKAPAVSLNIRKVFNGNIDSKKVHDIKNTYGVNVLADAAFRNGVEITSFKDARNDLAHGNISFSEYGNDNPYSEVISKSTRVTGYMNSVISAFDIYIDEQKYKS
ncbi:TPA: MAE_28990/MAE_18760 family HEPN-like nuclease [Vibrio parahaemolyticus]|nr:hypothetical protein [Vibrio parahaemolyticus]